MARLWEESLLSAEEISLRSKNSDTPLLDIRAIRNHLSQLEKKGAVDCITQGLEPIYFPTLSLKAAAQASARSMMADIPPDGVIVIILMLIREFEVSNQLLGKTNELLDHLTDTDPWYH